jgi:hypothetical protein
VNNVTGRLDIKHITPVLRDLHWSPVKFLIDFKILLLTFKALHSLSPQYINDLLVIRNQARYSLRYNTTITLDFPCGKMLCSFGDRHLPPCACVVSLLFLFSNVVLKLIFLN